MKVTAKIPVYFLFFFFALSQATETIYTAGLTDITRDLGINASHAQRTSSSYFLGFSLGILIMGTISDIWGRRPTMIVGLSIYFTAGMFCYQANSISLLIFLRFVQGIGTSVCSVVAQAMCRDSYKGAELAALYSTVALALAIMPAVGSIIGSNIVEYLGWRYNFLFLNIVSAFLLVFVTIKLKETNSYLGSRVGNFSSVLRAIMLDSKVLKYALLIGSFNGILYGFYIEAPFIFVEKLNISQKNYGYIVLLPLCISGLFGSLFCRWLMKKGYDGIKLIKKGLKLSFFSMLAFVIAGFLWSYDFISHKLAIYFILLPMLFQSFTYSVIMPLSLRFALEDYQKVNGTAGSIFGALYYFFIAFTNFSTSKLHSENVIKVTLLFLFLTIICNYAYNRQDRESLEPKLFKE